ncbi:MAG: hypothetical protein H5T86_14140, partial [Armatimonadetes bacterium]|nr:hypothetical protein [Armatimonadota bacterium]
NADFELELGPDFFRIKLHKCPALRWLREHNAQVFDDYCAHCPALYSRIMARHGYSWEQVIDPEVGCCVVTVRAVTPGEPLPGAPPKSRGPHFLQ